MTQVSRSSSPELRPHRPSVAARHLASVGSLRLPADILQATIRRLWVVALLYAAVFFMAAIFPNILCILVALVKSDVVCNPGYFTTLRSMAPPVLSILLGLAVFGVVRWSDIPLATKLNLGLVFEVLGSFGIAIAEYQGVISTVRYTGMEAVAETGSFGLSWVTAWIMVFTIVVPSPPRRALVAAGLSAAAVPISFAALSAMGVTPVRLSPLAFFFALIFPNILIVVMAGVAAHVVYGLGKEVRRARELGSYRLVEKLGEGGMGEVWRAEHRLLARPAAVKLIRPDAVGGGSGAQRHVNLRRFEREAQATASMRCPHTVELYDFGVADDGTFYYVMELLDGLDLDSLVREYGPQPSERVVYMLRQVCHSLGEAHTIDLIHRDIKPANIFACRYGRETDWMKVLDFGMVKHSAEQHDRSPQLTADNVIGGTPAYMAPEQALGGPIDGRADLYALGCVAYWLLAGKQVFVGRTSLETMAQHINVDPAPPSRHTELPILPELEALVLACLAKDPEARPQSTDQLAATLAAVRLDRTWTADRARTWWDKHRPPAPSAPPSTSAR